MLALLFCSTVAHVFAEPVVSVTPAGFERAREPQIAIDVDRRIYIAFGMANTLYLSTSDDGGKSYGEPTKIGEAGKLSLGMRRGPRITVHKGVVTVSAIYGPVGRGQDGDLVAWKSADKGKTWSGPARVNDVESAAREGLHAMAVAPDGTVSCTWLDMRAKGTTLYMSSSKDGGATWSKNSLVYASPSGTICECCHPSMTFDMKGRLYVMFRNLIDGARDMYLMSSGDLGKTFSPAKKLGQETWILNACPMDGGSLAVGDAGQVVTTWRTESTVYAMAGTESKERALGTGQQPWAVYGKQGPYLLWMKGRGIAMTNPAGEAVDLTVRGLSPVASSSPDRGLVIAAWSDEGIRALRVEAP
ncbi:MAG: exo-alpha-sialidase [Fimbriimonadaceae bacterium]|nr:exo-alpha-sialidase [Fimbriimonadaceae bacterium]